MGKRLLEKLWGLLLVNIVAYLNILSLLRILRLNHELLRLHWLRHTLIGRLLLLLNEGILLVISLTMNLHATRDTGFM